MKIKQVIRTPIVSCMAWLASCHSDESTLVAADPAVDNLATQWIKETTPQGLPDEKWAHDLVRENTAKAVHEWREAAADPRKVFVTKTQDTGEYVITVANASGKTASLWLRADGSVRSISGY